MNIPEQPESPSSIKRRFALTDDAPDATGRKPTNGYFVTIMHLVKGYVGTGIFAMGEAFKNSGIIGGPILLLILAMMNLDCQHILLKCMRKIMKQEDRDVKPSFGEIVEYTCEDSSIKCFKRCAKCLGNTAIAFLYITEMGFCCVYFVFISSHLVEVAGNHHLMNPQLPSSIHIMLAIILIPMWLSTFLQNLKLLFPLSIFANILMWIGVCLILYITNIDGLPNMKDRDLIAKIQYYPLFFGTALYAYEGITMVIPLRHEMKNREQFSSVFGVLNVGIVFVMILFMLVGIFSYAKYGDDVASSVFLNMSKDNDIMSDVTKVMMSIAVLFTFTVHMYVPFEVMYPLFYRKYGPFKHPLIMRGVFRSVPILVTYLMANVIPFLGLFISLIGASTGAFLSLILPPILELIAFKGELSYIVMIKDIIIITTGVVGAISGTILSVIDIVEKFTEVYG